MRRNAEQAERQILLGVGKALQNVANDLGKAVVRQVVIEANNLSIAPNHIQYVFWTLANENEWPRLNKVEMGSLKLAVSIMNRTGATPNYASGFHVPDDPTIDAATDGVIRKVATWSRTTLLSSLMASYKSVLQLQAKQVPRATGGKVTNDKAFDWLRLTFRQILDMRSRWFSDGELLRRMVRALPI